MKTLITFFALFFTILINSQCIQKIAIGYEHNLVIKTDGTLWGWGRNNNGELGLGTNTPEYFTPQLISSSAVWSKVFTGVSTGSFAIKNDGSLWVWGDGGAGKLGTGNQNDIYIPTQLGTATDWDYVTSGSHTIAKKTNGTLWGWGSNIYGQLNLGTNSIELNPVQISTATNWNKIVCGGLHTLAIKTDGTLWACGLNDYGQLGDGTTTNRLNFVQIGTDNDWVEITANFKHSVALKSNGTIWGWGYNNSNVLLPITTTQILIPTQIGASSDWAKVTTGFYLTTGLKLNGTLWRNDENGFFQEGTDNDWVNILSGSGHSFHTKSNGSIWGIGGNAHGQLGLGNAIEGTFVPTELECTAFLDINDFSLNNNFTIYPNPTNNILFIKNNNLVAIDKIIICDLTGKILFESTSNISEIDFDNFQNGIYLLTIVTEKNRSTYKIIRN
jgi:alpha-tubulin suppressor-like RCC1 family protein